MTKTPEEITNELFSEAQDNKVWGTHGIKDLEAKLKEAENSTHNVKYETWSESQEIADLQSRLDKAREALKEIDKELNVHWGGRVIEDWKTRLSLKAKQTLSELGEK